MIVLKIFSIFIATILIAFPCKLYAETQATPEARRIERVYMAYTFPAFKGYWVPNSGKLLWGMIAATQGTDFRLNGDDSKVFNGMGYPNPTIQRLLTSWRSNSKLHLVLDQVPEAASYLKSFDEKVIMPDILMQTGSATSWAGVFCLVTGFFNHDERIKTAGFNTIIFSILINLTAEHLAIPAFEDLDKAIDNYNGGK